MSGRTQPYRLLVVVIAGGFAGSMFGFYLRDLLLQQKAVRTLCRLRAGICPCQSKSPSLRVFLAISINRTVSTNVFGKK